MTTRDPVVVATSGTLAAAGVLHVAWATRAGRPRTERAERMADAVSGSGPRPSAAACLAVAGLLGTAATLVAGHPARWPRLVRTGQSGVAVALGARGVLGVVGRTDLVAPGAVTPAMRRWDRRLYTPLCLALAAGAVRSTRRT